MKRVAGLIPMAALVFTVACGQTDAGITTNVKTKFAADETVKAYQVDVDTKDHVVTLSGRVDNFVAKRQAVALARQTDGVRDVVDNIVINDAVATSGVGIDDRAEDRIKEGTGEAKDGIKHGANEVAHGAKKVGGAVADGAKKVGSEVADGAKKVGSEVKDAVTDDDPDTDKDGK